MNEAGFGSPFLAKPRLLESEIGFVIYDGFPVSEGHCLVVPHRVYANYFDSTQEELDGLHALVVETKSLLEEEYSPDGYNVGINCGRARGCYSSLSPLAKRLAHSVNQFSRFSLMMVAQG